MSWQLSYKKWIKKKCFWHAWDFDTASHDWSMTGILASHDWTSTPPPPTPNQAAPLASPPLKWGEPVHWRKRGPKPDDPSSSSASWAWPWWQATGRQSLGLCEARRGFFAQCKVESNNGSEARLYVYTGWTFCMLWSIQCSPIHAVTIVWSNPSVWAGQIYTALTMSRAYSLQETGKHHFNTNGSSILHHR